MKVLVEGAFYSPYTSEGRWAYNVCSLLSTMPEVELYLLTTPETRKHIYWKDFWSSSWFPTARLIDISDCISTFDVYFIIQGDNFRTKEIKARKRVAGILGSYKYGNVIDAWDLPPNTEVVHAFTPYKMSNWPKRYQSKLLPYAFDYTPGNNFENKGILLTMKDVIHPSHTEEETQARLDHWECAVGFACEEGIKVSVTMGHRLLYEHSQHKDNDRLNYLIDMLKRTGVAFYDQIAPSQLTKLVKEHSIIYTGKLGNVTLGGCFYDAVSLGSVPLIYSDWVEQIFKDTNLFAPYTNMNNLINGTRMLLDDQVYYENRLAKLRNNIDLYDEEQGRAILKDLMQ